MYLKYISFVYLPFANAYIYKTASDDYESLIKGAENHEDMWTIIYEFKSVDYLSPSSVPSPRYEHKQSLKGKKCPSYLSPTPMNYATNILGFKWYFCST